MKQYNRPKSAAEVLLHCAATNTTVDTRAFNGGNDYLIVHLLGPSGDTLPVMFNTVSGRFFHCDDEDEGIYFSSDQGRDDEPWFAAMLDFFNTDLPPSAPIPVTLQLSQEVVRELFMVVANCNATATDHTSHGELDITSLLTMLAEDAAMTSSRPGSWEGANMAQVLASHGYN